MYPFDESIQAALLPVLLDQLHDAVYMLDRDMKVVFWSRSAQLITGYSNQEMLGKLCSTKLEHCTADGKVLCEDGCPMRQAMAKGVATEATVYVRHQDGHRLPVSARIFPIRDQQQRIIGAVQVFTDNVIGAMALSRMETLEQMASTCPLTKVRNRRFMVEQLQMRLEHFKSSGESFGCIYLDMDRFKGINDCYGHAVGDEAIQVVAKTLRDTVGVLGVVGRWGGDEFLIIVDSLSQADLFKLSHNLVALVRRCRLETNGHILTLGISLGATQAGRDDTSDSIMGRLDQLLYKSKSLGRNRICLDSMPPSEAA